MPLFELSKDAITGLERVDFTSLGIKERGDLQRLLRDNVGAIAPETLIISEEFSSWDRSDRRIDLLGIDRQGRIVVIELKRTTDDSLADLQALRYAAMVSQMTFEETVETYRRYLVERNDTKDPRASLLEFLGWADGAAGRFGEDVRLVLAAADFSPEVTSTVLWLNQRDLDITCIRLQPYRLATSILLDIQQIIPLPEAADYQVQIRQKQRETRAAVDQAADWTRYDVTTGSELHRALYKRDAMFVAIRYLIQHSIAPGQIEVIAGRRLFEVLEGNVDDESFRIELSRRRPNDPKILTRYFCRDGQPFVIDGKTYALTTQWTKDTLETTLSALTEQYGGLGLSYRAAGEA